LPKIFHHLEYQRNFTEKMIKENTESHREAKTMTKPEFETMGEMVSTLPINKQVFVFIGLALVITALLGDIGHIFAAVLGMTMIFSAMLKLRIFEKLLEKLPWNSKK